MISGKFAKTLVIQFNTPRGMERWLPFFDQMRGFTNTSTADSGAEEAATEAYRFDQFISGFEHAAHQQSSCFNGSELILDFDSENRLNMTWRREARNLHVQLKDPQHAFQLVDQDAFRGSRE